MILNDRAENRRRRRRDVSSFFPTGDVPHVFSGRSSLSRETISTPMAVLSPLSKIPRRPSRRKLTRRSRTLLLVFSTSPAPVSGRARHGLSTFLSTVKSTENYFDHFFSPVFHFPPINPLDNRFESSSAKGEVIICCCLGFLFFETRVCLSGKVWSKKKSAFM